MRKITFPLLLVSAMAVAFPVSAATRGDGLEQRIERRCAEEPDRCDEIRSWFEQRRARFQAWCEEYPQKCEERKARHAERRAWCDRSVWISLS